MSEVALRREFVLRRDADSPPPKYEPQAVSAAGIFVDQYRMIELSRARVGTPRVHIVPAVLGPAKSFETLCVAEFELLAQTDPSALVRLAKSVSCADDVILAQVAEALALATVRDENAIRFLRELLTHSRAFVREAAIYGLAPFFDPELRKTIKEIEVRDPSPGVRAAAGDALAIW